MRILACGIRRTKAFDLTVKALKSAGFDLVNCVGFDSCVENARRLWGLGNVEVFAAPTPLTVRIISKLIKGKGEDAAVISIPPNALHATPILNAHWGGLMICEVIESLTGIKCVDTSSASCKGMISIDDLAFRLRASLVKGSVNGVSEVVKGLVGGSRPRVYVSEYVLGVLKLVNDLRIESTLSNVLMTGKPSDADLCIASSLNECLECGGPCYALRRIAVGLGLCSIASPPAAIQALMNTLNTLRIPLPRVNLVAVPSTRSGHGLVRALKSLGLKVVEVGVKDSLPYGVPSSEGRFGIRSVAEALARHALGGGESLIVKASYPHVTVSVVEGDIIE